MSRNWARTAVAVVAALVFPGLGHFYLRKWVRGLLWAGGVMTVAAVVLGAPPESMGVFEGAMAVARQASPEVRFGLFALVFLNALDAGLLSQGSDRDRTDAENGGGRSCPNCGKTLDDELDFCPWCTTEFDGDGDLLD